MMHVYVGVVSFVLMAGVNAFAEKSSASLSVEGIEGERLAVGVKNPFREPVLPIDPKTKKTVDRVLMGPVFKTKLGSNFDYYRFVTFYSVQSRREQIYSLPVHREQCDVSTSMPFASYTFSYTVSSKVSASISLEGLGLSADITESHTQTTNRQLQATGTEVADHTPFMVKEDWDGFTYLQTYDQDQGREQFLLRDSYDDVPLAVKLIVPHAVIYRRYPMPFSAREAAWRLEVDRQVIASCDSQKEKPRRGKKKAASMKVDQH